MFSMSVSKWPLKVLIVKPAIFEEGRSEGAKVLNYRNSFISI